MSVTLSIANYPSGAAGWEAVCGTAMSGRLALSQSWTFSPGSSRYLTISVYNSANSQIFGATNVGPITDGKSYVFDCATRSLSETGGGPTGQSTAQITAIQTPASAAPGSYVTVTVYVYNAGPGTYVAVTFNTSPSVTTVLSPNYQYASTGQTVPFTISFTMPSQNITFDIWSWWWNGTDWTQGDYKTTTIPTSVPASQLRNLSVVSVQPSSGKYGDTVAVNFKVDHYGSSKTYTTLRVSLDNMESSLFSYTFPQDSTWKTYNITGYVTITRSLPAGQTQLLTAYAEIIEEGLAASLSNCFTLQGETVTLTPTFRNFKIVEYSVV